MASVSYELRGVARRTEMPGFIKPQLATLKDKAPSGVQWIHEIKYDGYTSSRLPARS
jgi:ATP-dependent DNA ligase